MIFVEVSGKKIPAIVEGNGEDYTWGKRDVRVVTCKISYEEAANLFADNAKWSVVNEVEELTNKAGETIPGKVLKYDNSDYCVAGPITDNRDGTVSVKMGKMTAQEILDIVLGGKTV